MLVKLDVIIKHIFGLNVITSYSIHYTKLYDLTETDADNINAMFGPDNQSVIFQSNRNGNWDIYIIDAETGSERQLTTSAFDDVNPYWSPDKDWIVFQSNRTGTWNIYLLNVSTGTEYTVTDAPYDVIFPSVITSYSIHYTKLYE